MNDLIPNEITIVKSTWVNVRNLRLWISVDRGGIVRVSIYKKGEEHQPPIAETWAIAAANQEQHK